MDQYGNIAYAIDRNKSLKRDTEIGIEGYKKKNNEQVVVHSILVIMLL